MLQKSPPQDAAGRRPAPDQWVREAGSLLAHAHLHDTDGLLDRRWPPREGDLNWYAIFAALNGLEAMPRLILEVEPGKITQSVKYFQERYFGQ